MHPAYRAIRHRQNRIKFVMDACKIRTASWLQSTTFLLLLFTVQSPARASVALFMEEPYGTFGAMNPTGHAAVYLSRICADSPTMLRPCHEGEYGVVISRFPHRQPVPGKPQQ